jgi:beta-galactosidase GanA
VAAASGNFTWDRNNFYLNGAKYQIIGGQIDPQRVPREYWAQRLQMAKSMGLNTIFSYLYWHEIEKYQGHFDFSDRNDVAAWFQTIQDAGLKAVLRPGPYVCAERDWGGLPGWLTQIPDLKIRSNNQPFLTAGANYLNKVGAQLQKFLVTNGGPILLVQIENEYGYVGSDMNYKRALSQALSTAFPGVRQYTNDGASGLKSGYFPGALAVVDGSGPKNAIPQRDKAITDPSSLGPLMDGEVWITWFDAWGPRSGHAGAADASGDIDWILGNGYHFSLYMFHGGTSFNFGNGAGGPNPTQPQTTSYDYGAVLDETGRAASTYNNMRNAIAKHVSNIPAVPSNPPLQSIPDFALTPVAGWFDNLANGTRSAAPKTMEGVGQVFGYILYEHVATASASGKLVPGSGGPRDRVIVYVNGVRQGVIDSIYKNPATVNVSVKSGDKLWLLVENLGRVNNGFSDQTKGISGAVTVGGQTLTDWMHYTFPLDSAPALPTTTKSVTSNNGPPVWYRGTFANSKTGMAADTLLELPGGIKGVVFVNGHNLGRYWTIGPQQQLFVPGAWLKDSNEVLVLELEPKTASRTARGLAKRTWGNNPDPDCNGCS